MNLSFYLEAKFDSYLKNLESRNYLHGFIAAKRAAKKGQKIAILTARQNKDAHEGLIKKLEKQLGVSIPRELVFFVNDSAFKLPKRYTNSNEKKLYVLLQLVKKYDKVKFHDDEAQNIDIVNKFAKMYKLYPKIKAYNISDYNVDKLKPFSKDSDDENVIQVFDLDGTVIKIPNLKIRLIDSDGKVTKELSQEEFAKYVKQNGDEPPKGYSWDKSDFSDGEKIKKQMKGNPFKKIG